MERQYSHFFYFLIFFFIISKCKRMPQKEYARKYEVPCSVWKLIVNRQYCKTFVQLRYTLSCHIKLRQTSTMTKKKPITNHWFRQVLLLIYTFNDISDISWRSVLLFELTRVFREKHQPVTRTM